MRAVVTRIAVTALNDQLTVEGKIAALKKMDSGNAGKEEGNAGAERKAEAARQQAEMMQRLGESAIAGDRAVAEAQLTIHRGTIEQRLALDLDFAQRGLDVKLAANQAEIAALDKGGKDYINKLHELQGKALELTAAHDAEVASLTSRAQVAEYQRDLTALEQAEREKITNTQQGTRARIASLPPPPSPLSWPSKAARTRCPAWGRGTLCPPCLSRVRAWYRRVSWRA